MRRDRTILLTVYKAFHAAAFRPWTASDIAGAVALDVDQVRAAVKRLLLAPASLVKVGGNAKSGLLYQFVEGSPPPEDHRGKHKQHVRRREWAESRKQRQNLSRARMAKAVKARKARIEADLPKWARGVK